MASLLMHLAGIKEIIDSGYLRENEHFYLGSILPDGTSKDDLIHTKTHFTKIDLDKKRYIDFEEFRGKFSIEISTNYLYLGYYLHLLQDAVYRKMLGSNFDVLKHSNEDDFRFNLYSDYQLINRYLTDKYALDKVIVHKVELPSKIGNIAVFDIDKLRDDVTLQTSSVVIDDDYHYLNKDMVDEWLDTSTSVLKREVINLFEQRNSKIKSLDYKY